MTEQRRKLVSEVPGPRSRRMQVIRDRHLPPGLGNTLPVFVDRSDGGIVVDVDGNQFIDLASGIAVTSVGARAPEVVERVRDQLDRFTHTCFLVTEYESYVEVAAWLNEHTPGDHAKTTALFSTGAEAVENAVKIARAATGRPGVVVFEHAFHGRSMMALAMTAKDVPYKAGFGPFADQVYRAPLAYPLRWPTGAENATAEALSALEVLLGNVGPETIAAVVIEPIQGEGGFVVPSPGFLAGVQEISRRHEIVFVVDEIQTGIARTGRLFASEYDALEPDLVVTAKALGGGLPLAAVTGRAEIMAAPRPGSIGGTYAGNPLACAAALGVFEAVVKRDLVGAAQRIEASIRDVLGPVVDAARHAVELRGRGAMMAVEFAVPGSLEPAAEVAARVSARCHQQGVLTLLCGTYGNVVRLLPPLVIDDGLLREGLGVLTQAIEEYA
ncbi:4-aminobutyrate--2-oxoglutarate transaminase [Kribbella sp. GL6]|uniref:4-aminobutyrate--2-oxoglutarate transaminase n=1 Tax=Kribbella sp. GL6 TaxID=3419765 RepID=UPI003CFD218B